MKYFKDITKEAYFKLEGYSRSSLKEFIKGPDFLKEYKDNPPESTASMRMGTALDTLMFHPGRYELEYCEAPEGMMFNRKDGIDFKKANEGKICLNHKQVRIIKGQQKALMDNKLFSAFLESAVIEPCAQWEEQGVTLKTLPDMMNEKLKTIVDLKTIGEFNDSSMEYAIKDYYYDLQGALALQAFPQCDTFILAFVSAKAPHQVALKYVYPEVMEKVSMEYKALLPELKQCIEMNTWKTRIKEQIVGIGGAILERRDPQEYEEF